LVKGDTTLPGKNDTLGMTVIKDGWGGEARKGGGKNVEMCNVTRRTRFAKVKWCICVN